jgi:hypothetical protein
MMTEIPVIEVVDGTILLDGVPFDPEVHQVGWQVFDPDGNVVDSGPIVIAEMTGETAELLGVNEGE